MQPELRRAADAVDRPRRARRSASSTRTSRSAARSRARSSSTRRSTTSRISSAAGRTIFRRLLNTDALGPADGRRRARTRWRACLTTLSRSALPTTVGAIPSNRLSDQGSLFGSFDFMPPTSTTGQAFNLVVQRQLEPADVPAGTVDDRASRAQRRPQQLERGVFRGGTRATSASAFSPRPRSASAGRRTTASPYLDAAERQRARELDVRRRHVERAERRVRRQARR